MNVTINGESKHLEGVMTVAALLEALRLPSTGIAVERNREIVRHGTYEETMVEDGDEFEIVTLVGGG